MSNFQAHFLSFLDRRISFCGSLFVPAYPQTGLKGRPLKSVLVFGTIFLSDRYDKTIPQSWRKGQRGSWWENSSHLQSAQVLRLKLVLNISKHCWSLPHTACEENLVSKVSKITQTTGKSACVYPLLIGPLWNCAQPFCLSSITSHFSVYCCCFLQLDSFFGMFCLESSLLSELSDFLWIVFTANVSVRPGNSCWKTERSALSLWLELGEELL